MKSWLRIALLTALVSLPISSHAYNFFNAFSPTLTQIDDHTYRFRIQVDYNFDMWDTPEGYPSLGAFTGFSLGHLLGQHQRNFRPWSDQPGEYVNYSDGWWRAWHLGFYPLSLPGNEFGYDFDYDGDLSHPFAIHYTGAAMWAWFDNELGMQYRSEEYRGAVLVNFPPSAAPHAIPEPTTAFMWLSAMGVTLISGRSKRRVV